jgi:hypothetical protein
MKRIIICGALMALVITTAAAQTTQNRNRASGVEEAPNGWGNCSTDAIIRLDDGRSDAASVARAAMAECSFKRDICFTRWQRASISEMPPQGANGSMR